LRFLEALFRIAIIASDESMKGERAEFERMGNGAASWTRRVRGEQIFPG
jgi:hypothetical protein